MKTFFLAVILVINNPGEGFLMPAIITNNDCDAVGRYLKKHTAAMDYRVLGCYEVQYQVARYLKL